LKQTLSLALVTACLCVLAAGCIFSPAKKKDDDGGTTAYPRLDNPQKVLSALQQAYGNRDSVEYEKLYDVSYIGTSTDFSNPDPDTQVSTFRKADELSHIGVLQHSTTISSVKLDLGPNTTWARLPSDDPSRPEWAQIQISQGSWYIDILDGRDEYLVQSSNSTLTFTFAPTVVAPADTLWKIIRWNEIHQPA